MILHDEEGGVYEWDRVHSPHKVGEPGKHMRAMQMRAPLQGKGWVAIGNFAAIAIVLLTLATMLAVAWKAVRWAWGI